MIHPILARCAAVEQKLQQFEREKHRDIFISELATSHIKKCPPYNNCLHNNSATVYYKAVETLQQRIPLQVKMIHQEYIDYFSRFLQMKQDNKDLTIPEIRQRSLERILSQRRLEPVGKTADYQIPTSDGQLIPIKIIYPKGTGPFPLLLSFHGGGWVFGSIESSEQLCCQIANRVGCAVCTVGYRLAPENRFPKGLEDCYTALVWTHTNAHTLDIDPSRIAVSGESAGGNLAAAVSLLARDRNGPPIVHQLLIYPVTTNEFNEKIYAECQDQVYITLEGMKNFWNLYLNDPKEGDSPYASPLKVTDASHLPPATVMIAEHDALWHEGLEYAKLLESAKVPVFKKLYKGAIHSFLLSVEIPRSPHLKEGLEDITKQLKQSFNCA